jgi:DmsE family decaheme c-type cytochrome
VKLRYWILTLALLTAANASPDQKGAKTEQSYAGSVVCQGCHEDINKAFMAENSHRVLETNTRRGWQEQSCEACHGPGMKHSESADPKDILNPARLAASQSDRSCLTCHLQQQTSSGRISGGHARSQVACVSCHSVHGAKQSRTVARTESCAGCHPASAAEFQRPFTHPLRQGSMTCVDCHNPHGSRNKTLTLSVSLNEPGCFRCHGDKRGPFTFEHAPMRLDGCIACHQPHGSANPRMLTRHEVRFQCMECHTNTPLPAAAAEARGLGTIPPAFHDLRSPRFRNCTTCHIKIHGSHVNRALTR